MRRLLIAASLGLGLLAAGGAGSAFARPLDTHARPEQARVTRVEYGHRHVYAPPPRHWHHPVHHDDHPHAQTPFDHRGW